MQRLQQIIVTKIIVQNILNELQNLGQDVNQRGRNRSTTRYAHLSHDRITTTYNKPGPARQLITSIAARPTTVSHCWYHKRHGIATNPANCPGQEQCSWNQQGEIIKMQEAIKKVTQHSAPPKKRPNIAPSTIQNSTETTAVPSKTTSSAHATITAPVNVTPENQSIRTNWSEQIDMETINSTLEHDLLLSDTE